MKKTDVSIHTDKNALKGITVRRALILVLNIKKIQPADIKNGSSRNKNCTCSYYKEHGFWGPVEKHWQVEQHRIECNTIKCIKVKKCLNSNILLTHSKDLCCSSPQSKYESAIADSGTTNTFVNPKATVANINSNTPTITVKVANGQYLYSNGTEMLTLQELPKETTLACIMPGFPDSLIPWLALKTCETMGYTVRSQRKPYVHMIQSQLLSSYKGSEITKLVYGDFQ